MKLRNKVFSCLLGGIAALTCMSLPTLQETVPQQLSASLAAPSLPVSAPAAEEELPAAPTHRIDGNQDALNEQLDTLFQQYGVKGCSVAAFEGEEIVYTHSYGIARGNQPADENTKYRIASISKAVTATLAMHLVDQGKLSLGDELASIHPALQNPAYPDDPATLQMLLTHTSGIIDGAGYNRAISRGIFPSLDVVMQSNNFSGSRPGERYSYSNFGLGLVCAAIEQATGVPFRDYAKSELFDPLGLDAGFMTNDIDDPQTIAALGSVDPLSWGDMEKAYSQIPLGQMYLLGQGELYISAVDLAKIGMILAGDGSFLDSDSQRVQFLSQQALEQMHTPLVYDPQTNTTRGLAVQMTEDILDGTTLWGHQGNAYGVISCLFYDRDTRKGVVFLNNRASQMRTESKVYAVNDAVVKAIWQYLG